MTQLKSAIMSQILIGLAVIIGNIFLFLVYVAFISNSFTAFCWNDYQGILTLSDFIIMLFIYYIPILIIISAFGIFEHNLITNLVGVFWAISSFDWLSKNFTIFQPYFFTTWEGRLYMVDIGARVLVLLLAVVGIAVTCQKWYKYYKT